MSEPGKLQSRRTFKATFYFWSTRLGQWEKLIVFDGEAVENDEKLASKEKELKWPFYYQTTLSTQNWGHLFAPTAVKDGKRWTQVTKEDVCWRLRSKISTNGGFQNKSGKTNRRGKEDLSERRKVLQSEAKKWNYPHLKNDFLMKVIDSCWWLFKSLDMKWASVVIYKSNRKVLGLSPVSSTTTSFLPKVKWFSNSAPRNGIAWNEWGLHPPSSWFKDVCVVIVFEFL